MQEKKLKVLLATGVYPPDIGGPATYVKILEKELPKHGVDVKIVTYGDGSDNKNVTYISRKQNIILRYLRSFIIVWRLAKDCDVLYSFDLISIGLSCALVKILKPKLKFIVRLGGDRQWENAVEKGGYKNTLRQYYIDKNFSLKEKMFYALSDFVLSLADKVIFNAEILKDIYVNQRRLNKEKTQVIKNILPSININNYIKKERSYNVVLFIGRIIKVRNIKRLIEAFEIIKKENSRCVLEIVGDGPEKNNIIEYVNDRKLNNKIIIKDGVNREDVLNKIFNSDVVVLPSITEINANTVIEALMLGVNVVITKESEPFFINFSDQKIKYINPLEVNDIASHIIKSILENKTDKRLNEIEKIACAKEKIVYEHLQIFRKK